MNPDLPTTAFTIAAFSAPIAVIAYGEVAGRTRLPCPEGLLPGAPFRILLDSVVAIGMLGILAIFATATPSAGDGPIRIALAAILATGATLAAASAADVQWRKRRIRAELRALLGDDVELRTSLPNEETFEIALRNGKRRMSHRLKKETAERAVEAHERSAKRMPLPVEVTVHPLPQSATLRAAVKASGSDPMGWRAMTAGEAPSW